MCLGKMIDYLAMKEGKNGFWRTTRNSAIKSSSKKWV